MTRILTAIVLVLLFSGCLATSVMPVNKKAMEDLMVSRKQESERVALALGDRVIQKDAEQVYSAFITALSELGGDFQGSCRVNHSRCFPFLSAIDLAFRVEPHHVRHRPVTDRS